MFELCYCFNCRLTSTCQKKCVSPKFVDSDLNKGEAVCLDRCVTKYIEIQKQIDSKFGVEMQAGQQKMEQMKQLEQQASAS